MDEDRITYDDLPHGRFEITTKEAVPKVILIEHPGETVVLHRQGSTLTVEHITNAPARMEELQAAQQGALRTFTLGLRDTFIERQQRADISQPTSTSSGGSSGTAAPSNPSDTSPITTHLTATDAITSPSSTTDSVTSSLSVASNNSGTSNTILVVTNTTSASVLPPLTLVVADAPALSNVAAYTASYTEGSGVTLSPDLTVNDVDSTTLASASVWISQGFVTGDVLVASTAGTSITASYNAASGVLTLTGTDTLAHYQQVLDSVTYASTGPNPTNFGADLSRTINWVVNDGAITSNTVTSTVSITAVDDAPVIGNASNTIDYTELQALAPAIAVALTASDVDNTTLASASVSISIGFLAGDVLAVTTAGTAITASYNAASGVLTLTGTDTLAHYQQVLDSVTYASTSHNPTSFGTDTSRTITWVSIRHAHQRRGGDDQHHGGERQATVIQLDYGGRSDDRDNGGIHGEWRCGDGCTATDAGGRGQHDGGGSDCDAHERADGRCPVAAGSGGHERDAGGRDRVLDQRLDGDVQQRVVAGELPGGTAIGAI